LTYDQVLDMPLGELLSLIAVEQIKHEDAKIKHAESDDDEIIPDVS